MTSLDATQPLIHDHMPSDQLRKITDEVPEDARVTLVDHDAPDIPHNYPTKSNYFRSLQDSESVIQKYNRVLNTVEDIVNISQELKSSISRYNWAAAEDEINTIKQRLKEIDSVMLSEN